MQIYTCQPPASAASSWVETTYTPPPQDSPTYATHTLLAVPSHWHELHDEVMTVLFGRMEFTVGGKTVTLGDDCADGREWFIPRGVAHGFTAIRGVGVSFRERTVPQGRFKGE
jgi:mannose-6-phosphate isomerase-like protein (cupin superfamily)